MDDTKLYAAKNNKLKELLRLTQTFSRDIKMVFGIEKCKGETRNEQLHNGGR
jgi:hypothetical protein